MFNPRFNFFKENIDNIVSFEKTNEKVRKLFLPLMKETPENVQTDGREFDFVTELIIAQVTTRFNKKISGIYISHLDKLEKEQKQAVEKSKKNFQD